MKKNLNLILVDYHIQYTDEHPLLIKDKFFFPIGWTSLMYAANKGFQEVVKILLEHGSDIEARNNKGRR